MEADEVRLAGHPGGGSGGALDPVPGGRTVAELLAAKDREIAELRARIAQLQAGEDAKADYQVHIVPGLGHLAEALDHLKASPEIREGDRLRVSGTDIELEFRDGIWGARRPLSGVE